MILSASRRTDIPAFYSEWLMKRIAAGYLYTRNPYNPKLLTRIDLKPSEDSSGIEGIVFWTKNPAPMLKFLPELDLRGYLYYFQQTITGYPPSIERHTPPAQTAVRAFCRLSDQIGPEKTIWRFDPILLTETFGKPQIIRLFENLARSLSPYTKRVIVSFYTPYPKLKRRMSKLKPLEPNSETDKKPSTFGAGLRPINLIKNEIAKEIGEICSHYRLKAQTCSEKTDPVKYGIPPGACIDSKLLSAISGRTLFAPPDQNQRKLCACAKSVDIGAYNSCPHGCLYCYAGFSETLVEKNMAAHRSDLPILIPRPGDNFVEEHTQLPLFP